MNDVTEIIRAAAARYGLDPDTFVRMGQIESGLNPSALNKGSRAAGLFQFIPGTARQYGLSNPMDAASNADAAMRLGADNIAYFRKNLGRDPTPGEIYLMHQQGAGGAAKLLRNPDLPAVQVVPERHVTANGGNPGMTAGQFAQLWTSKFGEGGAGSPDGVPKPVGQPSPGPQMPPPSPQMGDDGLSGVLMNAAAQFSQQMAPPKKKKRSPGGPLMIAA